MLKHQINQSLFSIRRKFMRINQRTFLHRLNRFFLDQAFYPLVFASLVCLGVFSVRLVLSHRLHYVNLVWNLALAWAPYVFSLMAVLLHRWKPRRWLLLLAPAGLWFIFFPNAPYILTDFYHLAARPPIPLWFDIGLISLYAISGCFLAVASLRAMQDLVRDYFGGFLSWMFAGASIAMSAVGVYLGRFGRWNSWDLFNNPKAIIKEIALPAINPLENPGFIGFTMLFTALMLVFYVMFVNFSRRVIEEV
jgi:uncharacterized membrane protein